MARLVAALSAVCPEFVARRVNRLPGGGSWNKWGDPLAGGNRLCRESPRTVADHLGVAANSGQTASQLPHGPRQTPRGERL